MDTPEVLERMRLAGLSPRTVTARAQLWARVERHVGRRLADWTTVDVADWWLTTGSLAPASRRVYLAHIRSFYVTAGIPDPTIAVRAPRAPMYLPAPVSDTQRGHLLNSVKGPEGVWIALMVLAGLRCIEVAALRPADLDAGGGLRVMGKGRRPRVVAAHPEIVRRLAAYGWPEVTAPEVSRRVGRVMRRAGVNSTAHKLRHTAGTAYYRGSGGDLLATARFLGHSNVATTMGYAATAVDGQRTVVDGMLT